MGCSFSYIPGQGRPSLLVTEGAPGSRGNMLEPVRYLGFKGVGRVLPLCGYGRGGQARALWPNFASLVKERAGDQDHFLP